MDTSKLKKFAQAARRQLQEQVTAKLKRVLATESPARRERPEAVAKLEERIRKVSGEWRVASGEKEKTLVTENWSLIVEEVAYTWFNRFCALRFMDVNGYNRIGVVSPAVGQFQPEILAEAKMGYVDEAVVPAQTRQQILALLDGTASSQEPQAEAYRLLVVAVCNDYHRIMPYLFERIDDYTELLMPDDLLSENSILARMRETIGKGVVSNEWRVASSEEDELATNHSSLATHPEKPLDVEIIGWLYQFYISEKKDEVFAALKKNKKITPENIPAATQLFTPNWIVRYLVENSLGRLWLLNRPGSKLIEQMEYYIKPEESGEWQVASGEKDELTTNHSPLTTDYLKISSPEEIKICDPACGSGHMLTYAFDLLYAIYEEEGYEPAEIPEKILTHNLYGVEIDERAGELAAFALTMKAREKQRRFFRKPVQPNICVLEPIRFEDGELGEVVSGEWLVASGVSREDLLHDLHLFREADNFGSLLRPKLTSEQCQKLLNYFTNHSPLATSGSLFLYQTHQKVLKVLRQADFLSPKYHVAVANPPYMGGKGMNGRLGAWAKDNYPNSKSDLFAMFIECGLELVPKFGYSAMVTMQSWMFLSSYETLRSKLMERTSIESMAHMANMVMGIAFGTSATVWRIGGSPESRGAYCYVEYEDIGEGNVPLEFPPKNERNKGEIANPNCGWFYRASAADFKKIPGSAITYWVSPNMRAVFSNSVRLDTFAKPRHGMATSDNDRFLRYFHEVSASRTEFGCDSRQEAMDSGGRWFPYSKGGPKRKWFGNNELVVNWENDGEEIIDYAAELYGSASRQIQNVNFYFREAITWSLTSSGGFAARYRPSGFLFDVNGMSSFSTKSPWLTLAAVNSNIGVGLLGVINPTMAFQAGDIKAFPFISPQNVEDVEQIAQDCVEIAKKDWDSYERSWSFALLPLLHPQHLVGTLDATYDALRKDWKQMTARVCELEEENNRKFVDAYGLRDELSPNVSAGEVTLTCNPHYRYGGDKTEDELEALLLADTMKEFISYAVGCMFGRYAIDKPGLILANQGETIEDYWRIVASDEWREASDVEDQLVTNHSPLTTNKESSDGSQKLQRSDRVAEGDGSGGAGLSANSEIPKGGALRTDQSGATGSSVRPLEHRRGASTQLNSGVQALSGNSSGISGGGRDSTANRSTSELSESGRTQASPDPSGRSQQNAHLSNENPDDISLATNHSPLATRSGFEPDADNVIPMLDGDWFPDDIAERFRKFLRVTFGEEHYEENLKFLENAIGKDIRKYFLRDFYTDHLKRYKKRPIYWLFSSSKGTFNALIYMHRYRPDTVSIVLNDYLREFRTKLTAHKAQLEHISISTAATAAAKTKALKDIEALNKNLQELDDYERDVLYPLATEQVQIDLDDGVKVNYPKFGKALKPIPGLT